MNRSIAVALLCALTTGTLQYATAADESALRKVVVDGTKVKGTLRPFNGVSGAPDPRFDIHPPASAGAHPPSDLTDAYRAAHVDFIRTHDAYGAGDIDARFGAAQGMPPGMPPVPAERSLQNIFPDMSADPKLASSYNFGPTDALIASIRSSGAEPLFRMGRSIGATAEPPDPTLYAEIIRHVVLHYNKGWANGFEYRIRLWEIWNEPDFGFFWTGSPAQYYELYEKAARAIKEADPQALIGGPVIARPLDGGPYREDFLDFVAKAKLPLDFFSWHFYTLDSNDPYDFVRIGREIRKVLDARGFQKTQNILNEWNADLFDREFTEVQRASFVASALAYMVDSPIDRQAFYRADSAFRGLNGGPSPVAHALSAFGRLQETPQLLSASGGDDLGFAVIAGKSKDQRTMQILISNYEVPKKYRGARPNGDLMKIPHVMDVTLPARRNPVYQANGGYDLTVKLPRSLVRSTVERYRIDEQNNFKLVDSTMLKTSLLKLEARLPAPGVELIVIRANQ